MSSSDMYEEFRKAKQDTIRKVFHNNGCQTWYFTDDRGREKYSLFGPRGEFQGTFPKERLSNG